MRKIKSILRKCIKMLFVPMFTGCYDNSGYAIYNKDRIKVICYGGPEYYNVFWRNGCFWIKQEQTKKDIEIYGIHNEPLYWLIDSYMGYYVIDEKI